MDEEHLGSPSDTERDGRIRLHVESVLSPEVRTIGTIR